MLANYQPIVDNTVRKMKAVYKLSAAEADDMESIIVVHIAELCLEPTQFELLNKPAYLATVSRNAAMDYIRVLLRQRNRTAILSDYHELPAQELDIDSQIWLEQALSALSPAQLRVITIYFGLDGLPPVQWNRRIAKLTGYTSGQVGQLLRSAMETLKKAGGDMGSATL